MARLSVLALIQVGDRHENESELADMAVEAQVAGLFGAEPQIQRHVAVAGVDWVLVHDGVHPVLGAHDLYVCICVCRYVHLYLSIYLSIGLSVCLSVSLSLSIDLSICLGVHAVLGAHELTSASWRMSARQLIYVYQCMYRYIYARTHTNIHSYKHTYRQTYI